MKVNGLKFREALRKWDTRLEVAATQFKECLWQFPNDERKLPMPMDMSHKFVEADKAIATLQSAQQQYNLENMIDLGTEKVSLSLIIKMVGNGGRFEKMWRTAAIDTGRDRWSRHENIRKTDEVHAIRQISVEDALKNAENAAASASNLRMAIALANTREVEIDIDPKYFE